MKFTFLVSLIPSVQLTVETPGWSYRDASSSGIVAYDVSLPSSDGLAKLVIRCDVTGDRTLSIQYKPSDVIGLAMGPVSLDWYPASAEPLSAKLVWEPHRAGAYSRDGFEDRNASDVAAAIRARSGTLRIIALDRNGDTIETRYRNVGNRELIDRVIAQCPWTPHPKSTERGF